MPPVKVLYNWVQFMSQMVDVSKTTKQTGAGKYILFHHSWKKKANDL